MGNIQGIEQIIYKIKVDIESKGATDQNEMYQSQLYEADKFYCKKDQFYFYQKIFTKETSQYSHEHQHKTPSQIQSRSIS